MGKNKKIPADMHAFMRELIEEVLNEEGNGLWANIRAKKARGEKSSHPNSKAYKAAVKAGEEINASEESIMEGATCCGRCGRVHKLKKDGGLGCQKPYIGRDSPKHCSNR